MLLHIYIFTQYDRTGIGKIHMQEINQIHMYFPVYPRITCNYELFNRNRGLIQ
ncbi:hypothetical protein MTYM_00506 [Methylococcales bacterium]|nr:hypothetical protein MTYM_00506 [Methylococcales bacterium]